MLKKYFIPLCCAIGAAAFSGCASHRLSVVWPNARPLGAELPAYKAPDHSGTELHKIKPPSEPGGKLRLSRALAMALTHNPKLASFSLEVRIKEARALQAGLLPNPELGITLEEFGGSGDRFGLRGAQTTLQLSQLIEMGGRRSARVRVSTLEGSLAAWDYETQRLSLFVETTLAFIDVLTAQEQRRLAQESYALSTEIYKTVVEHIKAGKVSPIEGTKAAIERGHAKITLENAKRRLSAARQRLAATWAGSSPQFDVAVGELNRVESLPPFERVEKFIAQNPDIARWSVEMEHRLAVLSLARARRVPNLTVDAGLQRFEAGNDTAFIVGVSMPLAFFDRNQGEILAARYGLAKARQDRKAAKVRTRAAVMESYAFLAAARSEAVILKEEVLPAARKAFRASRRGYQQGKFGYLQVLDAQRTFFETRARYTQVLANYHRGVAVLESLIGTGLKSVNADDKSKSSKPSKSGKPSQSKQKDENHDN